MADSTLDSELFILRDNWPGVPWPAQSLPTTFLADGVYGHNVAVASGLFNQGTKVQAWHTGTAGGAGYFTIIYLKLEMQDATNVLAAKHVVTQHTDAAAGGDAIYDVTNEAASTNGYTTSLAAIGLSAMTVDYVGWFLCGGVCPEDYVSALAGNFATTNDVAKGPFTVGALSSASTTEGEMGFDLVDADTELVFGIAFTTDAA